MTAFRRLSTVAIVLTSAVLVSLLGVGAARADSASWIAVGPFETGMPVACQSLAAAPDGSIYAGADGAVFRSDDGGTSWIRFAVPTTGGVLKLLADPADASTIYAGTGSGFFRSMDHGQTWSASGFPGLAVQALAIDAGTPGTLYAAVTAADVSSATIYGSTDAGTTWTPLVTIPEEFVISLAVDPTFSTRIFAGTGGDGQLFRSEDRGSSWMVVDHLLDPVQSLLVGPTGIVYAAWNTTIGFEGSVSDGSLRRSMDHGATWGDAPALPRQGIVGPLVDPAGALYAQASAGLYRSLDGGDTWGAIAPAIVADEFAWGPPGILYAAGFDGVHRLDLPVSGPCTVDATTLCLNDGRFQVTASFQLTPLGPSFEAHAVPVRDESGYFWFFSSDNVELMIKVLDGTEVNGRFWVFAGGLSSVDYRIAVADTLTGETRTYAHARGEPASISDTEAFAGNGVATGFAASPRRRLSGTNALAPDAALYAGAFDGAFRLDLPASSPSCTADAHTLCLENGRFAVQVFWQATPGGPSFYGGAAPLTNSSGAFTFFDDSNVELVVKVLDGTAVNGHHWVFVGGLSSVAYTVFVIDTQSNTVENHNVREYSHDRGPLESVADATAF